MAAASSGQLRSTGRAPGQPTHQQFRPDVEGLRAVAILLVVAYHAGIGFLPGGFVGVDVFFVISGFLITGLLVGELTARDRISIPRFYARRVRRLLPAIVVMVVVVSILCWLVLSPLRRQDTGGDVIAAGLFVANWRFAAQAVDYLAAQQDPSPMLHMWSLSVEEQFYLVWPALLMGLYWLAGRLRPARTRGPLLLAGMSTVFVLSLALSWRQTQSEVGLAYFSSFTRAWELALGGGLALLVPRLQRLPRPAAALVGWLGMLAIVVSAVRITAATPYPGTVALLPTLGAAAVLAGGASLPGAGIGRLLSTGGMRSIGRVSYGWYLWHWPLLVLTAYWTGSALGLPVALSVVVIAYGLAVLSLRLVEDPVRRSPYLGRHVGVALAIGLACTAVVVGAGLVLRIGAGAAGLPSDQAKGAAVLEPTGPLASHAPKGSVRAKPPPLQTSATQVSPSPEQAGDDLPVLYSDGCHRTFLDTSVNGCVFGDPRSSTTVVLFGDSHAANWFPALEPLAVQHDWRLVTLTKSGCPAKDIEPYNSILKRAFTECPQWRENAFARIAKLHPALVFTTSINGYSVAVDGAPTDTASALVDETQGWVRTLHTLLGDAASVVLLRDTPDMAEDVAGCVSANMDHLDRCAVSRKKAIISGQSDELAQDELGDVPNLHYLDMNDVVCPGTRCPAVIGNVLMYRDKDHLTATFVKTVAPLLYPRLAPLLAEPVGPPVTTAPAHQEPAP